MQRLVLDIFRCYRETEKPNYLFQRPETELSVHRINLLSTVLDTVKPIITAVLIIPVPFRSLCIHTWADPEGDAQARTF